MLVNACHWLFHFSGFVVLFFHSRLFASVLFFTIYTPSIRCRFIELPKRRRKECVDKIRINNEKFHKFLLLEQRGGSNQKKKCRFFVIWIALVLRVIVLLCNFPSRRIVQYMFWYCAYSHSPLSHTQTHSLPLRRLKYLKIITNTNIAIFEWE